ncbi:MAG: hypothetical protein D5S01_04780 [Halanaerobium sp. MSAO_Bac5]|nr:MAG: hypothetical protein D5S01_04780 [Halanaerobium sp. MSAO_Bac5]
MSVRFQRNTHHHSSGKKLKDIVEDNFYNKIYEGRASKIFNIAVNINDNILTLYNIKSKSEAQELVKFEVKEKLHRQYLKLYLEGLTGNQIAKYNKLHGNVLDKVMQIQLPDYGKPEVIKKVVTEYTQHEEEINELLKNISKTDTEIDKLVYELYCLNEEEIKIVEESLSDV